MSYAHLAPGAHVVEDTPTYQRVVTRSVAGWTEALEYKPGHEPVADVREIDTVKAALADAVAEIDVLKSARKADPDDVESLKQTLEAVLVDVAALKGKR